MFHYITYFEIAAFLSSLFAIPALKRQKGMLVFPFLLLVIVAVEFQQTFFRTPGSNALIYNIQIPIQQLLYLLILYLSTEDAQFQKWIRFAVLVFLISLSISFPTFYIQERFNTLSYGVGSVLLAVIILYRFYEMIRIPERMDFLKDPFFYLLFAYLLFTVGTLPFFTMGHWLYFEKGNHWLFEVFSNTMSILNYTLYTTYTLSFIWIRVKKR